MKWFCTFLGFCACCLGCSTGSYDIDENIGVQGNWDPAFAVPLGSATMTLDGIESWLDTDDFVLNEEGTEFVYVRSIPLFDFAGADLISWASESVTLEHMLTSSQAATLNAAPDGTPVNFQVPLEFTLQGPGGCDVDHATFSGGTMSIAATCDGPVAGTIAATFPTLLIAGFPAVVEIPIGSTVEIPLSGAAWNLEGSIPVELDVTAIPGPGMSLPGDELVLDIAVDPTAWNTLDGVCTALTALPFEGSYTIDLFSNRQGQVLHIADPKIILSVLNEQGTGAHMVFDHLSVTTNGGVLDIAGQGIENIPPLGPALPWGTVVVWSHVLENSNSTPSLSSVWDAATGQMAFAGVLNWLNPSGGTSLHRTGHVTGTATLEFPFNGYADGFVLRDTIESDIAGALEGALPEPFSWEDVRQVVVRVTVENGLPIGGILEGYFADSLGTPLESIFGGLSSVDLVPGQVDFTLPEGHPDAGRVIAPGSATWDVVLDGSTAAFLVESGCNRILLRASTTSHGAEAQRDVRFFPESSIRLACAARLDLDATP